MIKSAEQVDGEWLVSGPVHDLAEDYDGETMEKSGILNGLRTFFKLGAHVDREHLYAKTRNPDDIVGVAKGVSEVAGVPWLTVQLRKSNHHARAIWEAVRDGVPMGFSILGRALRRDAKNPKHITDTEITMVTIAAQPKSFGSRLQVGASPAPIMELAKAIVRDDRGWVSVREYDSMQASVSDLAARIAAVEKALTTGSGIVESGASGGQALRGQCLMGASADGRARKRKRRRARQDTEVSKARIGFDRLVRRIMRTGKSERSARAIAAVIGRRKYGSKRMALAARRGVPAHQV